MEKFRTLKDLGITLDFQEDGLQVNGLEDLDEPKTFKSTAEIHGGLVAEVIATDMPVEDKVTLLSNICNTWAEDCMFLSMFGDAEEEEGS